MIVTIKRGDLLPVLQVSLTSSSEGFDLSTIVTTTTSTVFNMRKRGASTLKISRAPASVVSSAEGVVVVRYEWGGGDTDTPGYYLGEWEFTVGGKPLTAPSQSQLGIRIRGDLG